MNDHRSVRYIETWPDCPPFYGSRFECAKHSDEPWTCVHTYSTYQVRASSRWFVVARMRCVLRMVALSWGRWYERTRKSRGESAPGIAHADREG